MVWVSLLVLLPVAAVLAQSLRAGPAAFATAVSSPEARAALGLSVGGALLAAGTNALAGTLVAWVLVREDFRASKVLDVLIDLPFALPTVVAGLVLAALYGPSSPLRLDLVGTRRGVLLALLFVTLPFVVRTVQPVLLDLDRDVEEAAAVLGAGPFTTFRRITLPAIAPAVLTGTALAFARALGEYGSVILISANLLGHTQVASALVVQRLEQGDPVASAAVATVLLLAGIAVLAVLAALQRVVARRG